jgi:hypothetical protein
MKSIVFSLVLSVVTFFAPLPPAHINQFAGKWVNDDPNTGGLSSLQIEVRGRHLRIQAWGKCHPTDCAWGYAQGTVYAASVQTNPVEQAEMATTLYITSFSQTILVIRPLEGDRLRVEVFTKFTDESGRADYTRTETFRRNEGAARN